MFKQEVVEEDGEEWLLVKNDERISLPEWFHKFRPEQLIKAEQAAGLLESGTDVVCLEADTGFGKSLFAELVRQLMKTRMVMVVPRIDLQKQFMDAFPYTKMINGRRNYPHGGRFGQRDFPAISCADCRENQFCGDRGCQYKINKKVFENSQVGIATTSYWLAAANYLNMFRPGLRPGPKEKNPGGWTGNYLTTFDECCTLEDMLLRFLGFTLNIDYIRSVVEYVGLRRNVPLPPVTKFETWPIWLSQIYKLLKECKEEYGEPDNSDVREVRWYSRLVKTIASISQVQPDWVYDPERMESAKGRKTGEAWKVTFKPLLVGEVGKKVLWDKCGKTVCCSATIGNMDIFMEETGLIHTDKKVEFFRVENGWDKWRKSIHRIPGISVVKKDRKLPWNQQEFWPEYIAWITWILCRYPNERTLIHAVSHELASAIGDELEPLFGNRILCDRGSKEKVNEDETEEEKEERLRNNEFVRRYLAQPGSVLISAKVGRGNDFKDWRCRNIILAKVPFPYLGDRRVKTRLEKTESGELAYLIHTVREVEQYFGRGNRHKHDWVRIWCLDDNFDRIVKLRGLLKKGFASSIRHPGDYSSKFPPLEEMEIGDLVA